MVKVRGDLTGKVFGRLKVLKQTEDYVSPNGRHSAKWLCECQCENKTRLEVVGYNLKNNNTMSCGCLNKEKIRERFHKTNVYELNQQLGIVYATNTNRKFYFSTVDYELIKDFCWCENKNGYLIGYDHVKKKNIFLHRLIMGARESDVVDHIDHDTTNNVRENLRICSQHNNSKNAKKSKRNTTNPIGVYYRKDKNVWIAYIQSDKYQTKYVYYGDSREDAIKERLKAEILYYGDFAPQKDLFEEYGIGPIGREVI